jgi:hypothetical protein
LWCLWIGKERMKAEPAPDFRVREEVRTEWEVSQLDDQGKEVGPAVRVDKLQDWRTWKGWAGFAGTLRYRAILDLSQKAGTLGLDVGRVGEVAEFRVNGRSAGVRLAPPYVWDITTLVKPEKSAIEIDVTNTAQARWKDAFSRGDAVSGLLGPVYLLRER